MSILKSKFSKILFTLKTQVGNEVDSDYSLKKKNHIHKNIKNMSNTNYVLHFTRKK